MCRAGRRAPPAATRLVEVNLGSLRERVAQNLRERLPPEDALASWLEALGAELADVLSELHAHEMDGALQELAHAGSDALPVLRRLEERVPDKQMRKLIRRSLHRLKTQGIDVGESAHGERHSVLTPLQERAELGVVTAPDPQGCQGLFLLVPVPGGTRIYEILLSDTQGVLHLERFEVRRREARSFIDRLQTEQQGRVLRVEGAAVRGLVRRSTAGPGGAATSGANPQLLAELLAGESASTPGERVREKLRAQAARLTPVRAEAILGRRMQAGVLAAWPFAGDAIEEVVRRLTELERSQLVLSAVQKRERVQRVLAGAAERVLDQPTRQRVAQRLEEAAAGLLEAGDEEGATAAVRTAEIVRDACAPLEVGYLRMLMELSCGLSRQQQRQRDEGKLILPS